MPAIAMFLHSRLESFDWLPVKIQKSYLSEHTEDFEDVIEAATRPFGGVPEPKFPDHFTKDNLVEVNKNKEKRWTSKYYSSLATTNFSISSTCSTSTRFTAKV